MAFNVNELLGKINENGGLTKTNLFEVVITKPGSNEPALTYFCESAHLPGLSFQTEDIKPSGYGISEKRPHGATFQDIQLTFFADVNKKVYSFFHQWMQSVMNFNKKTSPGATAGGSPYATFAYPKDYYGSLQVTQFHEGNGKVITFDFIDAFPITIGDVQLDWGQENQLVRLPVTFAYSSWSSNTLDPGTTSQQSQSFNLTDNTKITRLDQQVNQGNSNLNNNPFSNPGALPAGIR
jgi:hypothetical protein